MTSPARDVLSRKLRSMFPDNGGRDEVIRALDQYGTDAIEREVDRVQLDILKLAGTSIKEIQMWVNVAKRDYRDVLASAEFPNQLRSQTWKMPKEETTRIQAIDSEQYEGWINQK